MSLVEGSQQLWIERAAIAEHGEQDAGEFMSSGGDGRRGTEFGTKTAKIVTQARVAAIEGCRKSTPRIRCISEGTSKPG